eukprot:CCRYP_000456-RA/>CCRYP_000456-RA protein AED:0.72 eAED:1.00 QI:0/0/0/1/0/0/2/0/79
MTKILSNEFSVLSIQPFPEYAVDWQEAKDRNVAWDESVITDLISIDAANHAPTIDEREVLHQPIPPHGQNDLQWIQLTQ